MAFPPAKKKKGSNGKELDDQEAEPVVSPDDKTTVLVTSPPVITAKPGEDRRELNFTGNKWGGNVQEKFKFLLKNFEDKRIKHICKNAETFIEPAGTTRITATAISKDSVIDLTAEEEQSPDFNLATNFADEVLESSDEDAEV